MRIRASQEMLHVPLWLNVLPISNLSFLLDFNSFDRLITVLHLFFQALRRI